MAKLFFTLLPAIGGPTNDTIGMIEKIIVISSRLIPILNPCKTKNGACKLLAK